MLITTKTVAESMLETRVYPFRSGVIQQTELAEYISSCVAPNSWAELGGEGFIAPFPRGLIIRQTAKVHDEIAELLRQFSLSEAAAK